MSKPRRTGPRGDRIAQNAAKREFLPGVPLALDGDVVAEAERIVRGEG